MEFSSADLSSSGQETQRMGETTRSEKLQTALSGNMTLEMQHAVLKTTASGGSNRKREEVKYKGSVTPNHIKKKSKLENTEQGRQYECE